jgi:hypothetical protein
MSQLGTILRRQLHGNRQRHTRCYREVKLLHSYETYGSNDDPNGSRLWKTKPN